MSSSATAADGDSSHSPPADDHRPSISVNDDEKHRSTDQKNENFVENFGENSVESSVEEEEDLEDDDESDSAVIMTKTDLLGFGNGNGKGNRNSGTAAVDGGGDTDGTTTVRKPAEISPDRKSGGGESYRYEEVYELAPDKNGRLRFDLVVVRENGRLRMYMVPNRWPQLVRSPMRDGRLRMWLLDDDDDGGGGGGGGEEVAPPPYDGGQ